MIKTIKIWNSHSNDMIESNDAAVTAEHSNMFVKFYQPTQMESQCESQQL